MYKSICVFSIALRSENFERVYLETAFENGSQDFSGTTHWTDFVQIYAYVKKMLVNQVSFFEKKNCSNFIYKKLMKNGVKIFKKKFKYLPFAKKRLLAHCFDSSKKKSSDLFWFKRYVLDNILTTARGLAENELTVKTT